MTELVAGILRTDECDFDARSVFIEYPTLIAAIDGITAVYLAKDRLPRFKVLAVFVGEDDDLRDIYPDNEKRREREGEIIRDSIDAEKPHEVYFGIDVDDLGTEGRAAEAAFIAAAGGTYTGS